MAQDELEIIDLTKVLDPSNKTVGDLLKRFQTEWRSARQGTTIYCDVEIADQPLPERLMASRPPKEPSADSFGGGGPSVVPIGMNLHISLVLPELERLLGVKFAVQDQVVLVGKP